mmetsp:Transcript_45379/g.117580  ORF Transcript_45379/g.117580 Transcript_45379/m.117580 type:complete len:714 (-) Transcript_45379:156-2297(-)
MVVENENGAIIATGEVRDALPAPDLVELRTPATHTKVVGVIYPPPDIRAIVDKTAGFVARNGTEFEKRILANEKQNQKFSFLLTTDPYHAYYQLKIKETKEADSKPAQAAGSAQPAAAEAPPPVKEPEKPAIAPTKPLEAPAPEVYSVHLPQGLTPLDVDVVKLTAQFVARNGKAFLTGLASREHANPQFNFLKPTHSMFTFFTALADAYSKVLMPPKGTGEKLEKASQDREVILERALKRLEWDRHKEAEAQAVADEQEAERVAMASIDWHDFTVVETIEFDAAEDEELPPPMVLKDVIQMSKASAYAADDDEEDKGEMEMEMDDDEKQMVAAGVSEQTVAAAEGLPENIKVVKNYRRTGQGQEYDPTKYVVSPITGELVAIDQMAEHMRISLIDPRWKEQKEAMLSKIKTTTKANDDEISRNIIQLAGTRPDIFGSTEEEMSAMVHETIKEKRTAEQRDDGASNPNERQPPPGLPPGLQASIANANKMAASLPPPSSMPSHPFARPSMLPPPPGLPFRPPMGFPPGMPPPGGAWRPPPGMPPPGAPWQPPPQPQSLQPPPSSSSAPPPSSSAPGPPQTITPPPASAFPSLVPTPSPALPEKRARQDFVLRPESDVLVEYPGARKIRIAVPDVDGNDKLNGQVLEVEVASLSDTVSVVKARLAEVTGLAPNKQKLIRDEVGVLRDNLSLAHYNVLEDVQLTLGIKERGRGKK